MAAIERRTSSRISEAPSNATVSKDSDDGDAHYDEIHVSSHKFSLAHKRRDSKVQDECDFMSDEVFNTATHLAGAIFSIYGTVFLIVDAVKAHSGWMVVAFAIYGVTLLLMFLTSTFHHGLRLTKKMDKIFTTFDYCAIYLLIAGTYTPIVFHWKMRTSLGWTVFGLEWAIAAIGITLKSIKPDHPLWLSITFYISQGWIACLQLGTLISFFGWGMILLLLLGGVFYTVGAIIMAIEKPDPWPEHVGAHGIWHILVILASLCMWFIMYLYIRPGLGR